ncbi:MAG TPA: S9 family peptidase [Dongiaceae bacterium]|nr:S9 family peptidase [Dongiaceae bacterium]
MDKLAEVVGRLDRVRFPSDISFERGGQAIAIAVRPSGRDANESYQSRIWRYGLDGTATQLTHGPNGDHSPRCSPVDDRVAFASDRIIRGKADLFILDKGAARPLGDIPGTIEDIRWTDDGAALIVLAADRGLDGGATNGAVRIWWGVTEDPAITNPTDARRRLFKVSASDGATTEVGPRDATVWEFDLSGNDGAVALVSADASERGWYHARLAGIEFATRSVKILHESPWQLQSAAVSPSRKRVAFVEGWSSDRGLVAGEMRVLELATGKVVSVAAAEQSNISSLSWRDEESLWFAGWSRLGTTYGIVRLDGTFEWVRREDAVIGPSSFLAALSPAPDGKRFAAIREAVGVPPEIVFKTASDSDWTRVTSLNASIMAEYGDYPDVREVRWKAKDGVAMEALVLLPKDRNPGPLPTIVDIHGGPTWSAKYAFNPGFALHEAAAGYAVFLANYRGNTGWGQPYSRLNIGDPGGGEWDDIMAGIDHCIAEGIADPDRLGVTGASYGGYMTAWAVARTDRFKAAVMVSGISNQWSCHYSCNHDFGEFIVGGPLKEERYRKLAIERSPLFRLDKPATPTLIIHGELDRCTPLGQGQEFYSALLERGVPAELVVYPREGHGFQESAHKLDKARRVVAWFDRYLKAAR